MSTTIITEKGNKSSLLWIMKCIINIYIYIFIYLLFIYQDKNTTIKKKEKRSNCWYCKKWTIIESDCIIAYQVEKAPQLCIGLPQENVYTLGKFLYKSQNLLGW